MDQELKQRLVGVSVLAALMVIFVPMFFDDIDDKTTASSPGLPPLPEQFVDKKVDVPASTEEIAPKDSASSAEKDGGYKVVPFNEEAMPAKVPEVESKPHADIELAEEPVSVADEEPGVGTGKSTGSKVKAVAKKAAVGESPHVTVKHDKEPAYVPVAPRTWVPAKKPSVRAKKNADEWEDDFETPVVKAKPVAAKSKEPAPPKADHEVVTTTAAKPTASAKPPATGPQSARAPTPKTEADDSEGMSAWVIQTGTFTSDSNARSMADKLRKAKYPAFVEKVHGPAGVIYKVHVGPELNRARAEKILKQIESKVGIKGLIQTHQ